MLTFWQSILMGGLQGLTELFPISSLGHSVILPPLIGWDLDQNDPYFLTFLVATHFATAVVLFGFYWKDWMNLIGGFFRSLKTRSVEGTYPRLIWLLIVSTIPAGILGLLFEHKLEVLFAAPNTVAMFLVCNGILLFGAELLRRRAKESLHGNDERLSHLSWKKAIGIGFMQCLALFPGFSRTGATIAGGLLSGLSHEDSVRYSFFMATPIIGAAAVLKLPHVVLGDARMIAVTVVGMISSGVMAYLTVKFLTKYFKTNTLTPFAIYCVIAGGASLLILG